MPMRAEDFGSEVDPWILQRRESLVIVIGDEHKPHRREGFA
jgi:hypothetical protein